MHALNLEVLDNMIKTKGIKLLYYDDVRGDSNPTIGKTLIYVVGNVNNVGTDTH